MRERSPRGRAATTQGGLIFAMRHREDTASAEADAHLARPNRKQSGADGRAASAPRAPSSPRCWRSSQPLARVVADAREPQPGARGHRAERAPAPPPIRDVEVSPRAAPRPAMSSASTARTVSPAHRPSSRLAEATATARMDAAREPTSRWPSAKCAPEAPITLRWVAQPPQTLDAGGATPTLRDFYRAG